VEGHSNIGLTCILRASSRYDPQPSGLSILPYAWLTLPQMSMHFAPQWVKPIKPSSTPLSSSTDQLPPKPSLPTPTITSFPSVPFPALSSHNRSSSPNNPTSHNPTLSYSRVTHTPVSPAFPTDGSYFPHSDQNGENGHGGNPHPFRYSREQILGLWDEEKVREKPIELMELHEGGAILVSKSLVRPIGLRELSDIEKKVSYAYVEKGIA
jgi:PERQ amino acid-rich with GYF domain-containing protein